MYCNRCGEKIYGRSNVCGKCGGSQRTAVWAQLATLLAVGMLFAVLTSVLVFGATKGLIPERLTQLGLTGSLALFALLRSWTAFTRKVVTVAQTLLVSLAMAVSAFGLLWFRYATPRDSPTSLIQLRGQVLTPQSPVGAVPGASVYALSANFNNDWEFMKHYPESEAGVLSSECAVGADCACQEILNALIREYTGLSGPLDAKFRPIKKEWAEIENHAKFRSMSSQMRTAIRNEFWNTRVLENRELASLPSGDLQRYQDELFHRDLKESVAVQRTFELPAIVTNINGEFSVHIPRGKYLLVVDGETNKTRYIWAQPLKLEADSSFVINETVCRASLQR